MPNFLSSSLNYSVPVAIFEQLCQLWKQTARNLGKEVLLLAQEALDDSNPGDSQLFQLIIAPGFQALLQGKPSSDKIMMSLTFVPEAIAAFGQEIMPQLEQKPALQKRLQAAIAHLQVNDAQLQSEFSLRLIEILTPSQQVEVEGLHTQVCQPLVDEALHQQVAQERLLHQVVSQIRQSLELPVILATAVDRVHKFLQVDRLVIYQFDNVGETDGWGRITYEARTSEEIPSILHLKAEKDYHLYIPNCREKYRRGITVAVDDVQSAYAASHCLQKLLQQNHVRAKLVAPIIVQGKLWGLLIAHQCFAARQWQESARKFLGEIAEHLSIAIYQAQLFAQVQQQRNTLEQRIIERTQELQDALVAAQAASQSKSEFLAAMSHELRTPLTCVIGLASTLRQWSLQQNVSPMSLDKQQKYLEMIQNSGKNLLELINDILDLSQIEVGKMMLNISEFSLSQICRNILHSLGDKASSRQVTLQFDCQTTPNSDRIRADVRRVRQILLNLLSNAIKFTPAGGKVILRVWQEAQKVLLQVEDTGIGIAQDELPLLFEKFQQLENTYQRTYEGTGLGLALTKQLVEMHGGSIEVESCVGEGSTFTVMIPSQPEVPVKVPHTDIVNSFSGKRGILVLIANDDAIATMICELLTAADYQVVWLIDSLTAVNQIDVLQPQAVIIDRALPGMDVGEISQSLKQLSATEKLKILLLTTPNAPDKQQLGVDDYLLKPIEPQQLLEKINALVQ